MAGYCEMLVQSHTGEIRLLSALPMAWPDGKVCSLRACGGSGVDMTWKDGRVCKAVIHSRSGLPRKVVHADKTWEFETKAGRLYSIPPA